MKNNKHHTLKRHHDGKFKEKFNKSHACNKSHSGLKFGIKNNNVWHTEYTAFTCQYTCHHSCINVIY